MGKCQDLLEASRNGNVTVVKKILGQCCKRGGPLSSFRRSPSINTQDSNGYTPLHHACLNGHLEIVMVLLAANVTVDMVDIRGSTPLYLAAWSGHYDIVKLLLQHPLQPANANSCTIENETPLHAAAQNGYSDIVAMLLSYGADPTTHNNGFQTALDLAAIYGRTDVVQTIIRNNPELLQPFRLCDDHTILRRNGNTSPYTTSPVKRIFTHTCLHLAARNGHVDVVQTILKAGVDPNVLTNAGTALHEAVLAGQKSVVCSLLKAGVDPYALDGQGRNVWDIFKCYPRHVIAEIAALINEICEEKTNACDPRHFRPIREFDNDAKDTFSNQQIRQNK